MSIDKDNDGANAANDCDDENSNRYPGADEQCDGIDNDCDNIVDEDPVDGILLWPDTDGDGFGDRERTVTACMVSAGLVLNDEDCDDEDASISPRAVEQCDGFDNNCDGMVDDHTAIDAIHWFEDADGDGYGHGPPATKGCVGEIGEVENNDDCDDTTADIHPDAEETCDGRDNDCDGHINEPGALGSSIHYRDADLDGYGHMDETMLLCEETIDFVAMADDCDDTEPSSFPGADELCDGIDNTCSGFIDEGCGTLQRTTDALWAMEDSYTSISSGDLDGDGRTDLMTADAHSASFSLYSGPFDSDDIEPTWTTLSHDASSSAVMTTHTTSDVNDDGMVDLITAYPYLSAPDSFSEVRIHLGPLTAAPNFNRPDIRLKSEHASSEILNPKGTWFADVTGDGDDDILLYTTPDNALILWSDPHGEMTTEDDAIILATAHTDLSSSISINDYSGDGNADLIIGYPGEGRVDFFEGPIVDEVSLYTADKTLAHPNPRFGTSVCSGEVMDDGHLTVAIAIRGDVGDVSRVQLFSGSDDFISPAVNIVGRGSHHIGTTLNCSDVDGDDQADLLTSHQSLIAGDGGMAGTITMFHGPLGHLVDGTVEVAEQADRIWKGEDDGSVDWLGEHMFFGDFNDDGIGDIMASSHSGVYLFSGSDWTSHSWAAHP